MNRFENLQQAIDDLNIRDVDTSRDQQDIACPDCGPGRTAKRNKIRKVLRVWISEQFITVFCVRCGVKESKFIGDDDAGRNTRTFDRARDLAGRKPGHPGGDRSGEQRCVVRQQDRICVSQKRRVAISKVSDRNTGREVVRERSQEREVVHVSRRQSDRVVDRGAHRGRN